MAKVIISPGFGGGFYGNQKHRFDPELIRIIEEKENLVSRWQAFKQVHFPSSADAHQQAVYRLKFEELFTAQLRLGMLRSARHRFSRGVVFSKVGDS
jgi:RecG-like helicase